MKQNIEKSLLYSDKKKKKIMEPIDFGTKNGRNSAE